MRENGAAESVAEHAPAGKNVYLTIDTDFFDWSIVPGTVLPEPGGFTLEELRECVQVIAKRSNVVGFDVVCLNPLVDTAWYFAATERWLMGIKDRKADLEANMATTLERLKTAVEGRA